MTSPRRRVLVPAAIQPRPPMMGDVRHDFEGRSMGTTWQVRLCGAPVIDRPAIAAGIQACLDDTVAQMSTWVAESDLCRFNAQAPGAWQALPPAFCEVLACALEVAQESGGAFDPTVGPLVDTWGFGPREPQAPPRPPEEAAVADAQARCGWQRLEFDASGARARQPGGLALDFSAIAKGHAVDRIAAWLDQRGHTSHLVEVGGELKAHGVKPDGQPWWVEIEHPDPAATDQLLVALNGLAVATSGDYRRWFAHAGTRYAHTLDPRTGRPARHELASVSVVHADCMAADAWSTALTVMGVEHGLACATRLGLAARFLSRHESGWREHLSPACAALLA